MLIALVAPSGAGKSVVSKHLAETYNFERMHAGQPVKDAMRAAFGLRKGDVKGGGKGGIEKPNAALGGRKVRSVMEAMSDTLHAVAPAATSIALQRRLAPAMAAGRDVVVDGVRTQREADMISRCGGTLVRIDDGRATRSDLPMDQRQADVEANHVLKHNDSHEVLRSEADKLMERLMTAPGY